jgi:hypothetical protein
MGSPRCHQQVLVSGSNLRERIRSFFFSGLDRRLFFPVVLPQTSCNICGLTAHPSEKLPLGLEKYTAFLLITMLPNDPNTTGGWCFPECLMHSGKRQKHLEKASLSVAFGEKLTGNLITVKSSSPSAKKTCTRGTLGEELTPSTPTAVAVSFFFFEEF